MIPALVLTLPLVPGAPATLTATGAVPGETVHFGGGVGSGAAGPCPVALGGLCLDLGADAVEIGTAVADGAGVASMQLTVPALIPGRDYVVQAAIVRGVGGVSSVKSPATVVDATMVDHDGDGVVDAADRCQGADDADDPDADGVPTACDTCPAVADPAQGDTDGDGVGDLCEGPVLGPAIWQGEGDQTDAEFGSMVATADVNGDGYDDVLVGSRGWSNGQVGEGRVAAFHGSAAGPSAAPDWTLESNVAGAWLEVVGSAGDVNGDGYDDVVVATPSVNLGYGDGVAMIFAGSSTGLGAAPIWTVTGDPAATWAFGAAVSSAGDVNGDGYDDVLVGAPGSATSGVELYLGSATGPSTTPTTTLSSPGFFSWNEFGQAVASAGDVNGDGYDDVLVGAEGDYEYEPPRVALYYGSATGLRASAAWQDILGTYYGGTWISAVSVTSAGDVDRDGYDDFVVSGGGVTRAYLGGPNGPSRAVWERAARVNVVAAGRDVNGDGRPDLVLAKEPYESISVFLGTVDGFADVPATTVQGLANTDYGAWVALGDADGDGRSDVVVGAPLASNPQGYEGAAVVHPGVTP
ncbi:MAG: FG-GAP repeat protein [Alphaproteobacteria bacterium]|nr:FG-GAP repeat protein [Alphaproteobacteria bacterium]